jgi:hypothetical protein
VLSQEKVGVAGWPDFAHTSTNIVEWQFLTMCMSLRRFARPTNGSSKKIENLKAMASLQFAHYNFVRLHRGLRVALSWRRGFLIG